MRNEVLDTQLEGLSSQSGSFKRAQVQATIPQPRSTLKTQTHEHPSRSSLVRVDHAQGACTYQSHNTITIPIALCITQSLVPHTKQAATYVLDNAADQHLRLQHCSLKRHLRLIPLPKHSSANKASLCYSILLETSRTDRGEQNMSASAITPVQILGLVLVLVVRSCRGNGAIRHLPGG